MWHSASVARPRRTSLSRLSFLLLALTLCYSGAARADTWTPGAVITYDEAGWSVDPNGVVTNNYNSVYAATGGFFEVGIPGTGGFSMQFTNASNLLAYLPAGGSIGPLTSDVVNPTSTSSGLFGGDVVALKLNIDFSNAGLTLGNSGIPFGNLVLTGFGGTSFAGLDGMTVSQFLALDNIALGGGSVTGFSIADLNSITISLNFSFNGGAPSTFAQNNLVAPAVTPVPEPGTLLLLGTGLLGVVGAARRKWLG